MTARLQLHIGPGALYASIGPGEPPPWNEEIAYSSPDELRDAVVRAEAGSRGFRRSRQVRVSIAAVLLQQRLLTDLPPVSTPALRALVARGTSRFFRQNGHPLVSGAVWSSATGSSRVATAVAIDGMLAQSIVDGVHRSGLIIDDIVPDRGPAELSLLPESERHRRTSGEWRRMAWLAAGTAMLWLTVLTVLGARLWGEGRRVDAELRQLAGPRAALIGARQAMESATEMVAAIQASTDQRESAARRLTQVIDALPDSAYVEEVVISVDGSAVLTGRAARPRQLLKDLEVIAGIGAVDLQVKAASEPEAWEGYTVTISSGRAQ